MLVAADSSSPATARQVDEQGFPLLSETEYNMLKTARLRQHKVTFKQGYHDQAASFYRQGSFPKPALRSSVYAVEDLEAQALREAKTEGVTYVGKQKLSKRPAWLGGRRQLYFYSVVRPEGTLGKQMRVGENSGEQRAASMLWKHDTKTGETSLVHIDEIPYHADLDWGLSKFRKVLWLH